MLKINLAKPLPRPESDRDNALRHPPWSVELANGIWCISRGGINGIPSIHGKDVTYLCQRAQTTKTSQFGNAGVLLGPLRRLGAGWRIEHATGQRITTVTVRSAWW